MRDDLGILLKEDTLLLLLDGQVAFRSRSKWLHPLFELAEAFPGGVPAGGLLIDRVTGLGAAHMLTRLGVLSLETRVLSARAIPILERAGISHSEEATVAKLGCLTEDILLGVAETAEAWSILATRRQASIARKDPKSGSKPYFGEPTK